MKWYWNHCCSTCDGIDADAHLGNPQVRHDLALEWMGWSGPGPAKRRLDGVRWWEGPPRRRLRHTENGSTGRDPGSLVKNRLRRMGRPIAWKKRSLFFRDRAV